MLVCNATGTHRLTLWFIGTAQKPYCFKHNATAWMTDHIIDEWLEWFDHQMAGRTVLLMMDNFSAHEVGLSSVQQRQAFHNTHIIWLLPNVTSVYQLVDSSIIKVWKCYYRKQWLCFMVGELDQSHDLIKTMNVLKAVE